MQIGNDFGMNGSNWKLLEVFENKWGFFEGKRMYPSSTKPELIWDCGVIKTEFSGEQTMPNTLGIEDSKLNRDKKEIYQRYLRGIDKLKSDADRKQRLINEARQKELEEQKRLDILSGIESKKRLCLGEIHQLYEKSSKAEDLTNSKKFHELMSEVAQYESFRFFYRK